MMIDLLMTEEKLKATYLGGWCLMFVTLCCEVLPPHVTGYISRFLTEVNTGVYVGRVISRIAENLWERCCEAACNGRLTMIASSNEREQGFTVKTLNSGKLELIDSMDSCLSRNLLL